MTETVTAGVSILSPAEESYLLRTPSPSLGVGVVLVCPLENFRIKARSAVVERATAGCCIKNMEKSARFALEAIAFRA